MAGIEEAVTCAVCSEVYQTKKYEPVMVPCGHVFCRSCLINIERTGDLSCPSCRKDLNYLHIQDLPTCFPLLSLSSSYDTFQFNTCSEHGDDLMYWCQGCQLLLCGLCLYSSHPHGHDVRLASTCVQEKKQALQGQVNIFKQTIDGKKKDIKKRVSNCILKIKKLCQNSSQLHDIGEELAALSKETTETCNIESILISEAKVKSFQEKQLPFVLSSDVTDVDDITEEDCLAVSDTAAGKSRASAAVAQQQTPPGSKQAVNKCWARLECQDGRLLLHTLSSPIDIDSRLFLQMPSEVFLEVSVGNRCFGRVYIRLWYHLRRAQHFLALCHGTLGPSYVGASFVISAYGEERETLDVRKYVLPDGSTSNKVLIADMEWGGKFAGPANERIVMGSCHGADTHGFGICTRSQPNGTFQCPFGEVSSGMEVVKAVINHDPINEVTVTDCGLVIPEFKP